jgi:hypothetical protein
MAASSLRLRITANDYENTGFMALTLGSKRNVRRFPGQKRPERIRSTKSQSTPKLYEQKETENVLDIAKSLCEAANQNIDVVANQLKRLMYGVQQYLAFFEKFRQQHADDGVRHTVREVMEAFHRQQGPAQANRIWLAQQLAFIVDYSCWPDFPGGWNVIDPKTGHVTKVPANIFQELLLDVVNDPRIDPRRFARCAACQAFFYKPRGKSRACSRKCENVLMAREHYARIKRARELACQGKSQTKIAAELKVKPVQVLAYLRRQAPRS